MRAVAACRTCGTEPLENAQFCHGCGTPVAGSETHAEYKQVTVLFADVVRSMDIAATVGAERLREIMAELVNAATAVVHRYGGTVDKFTGDGIMAVLMRRWRWRTTPYARASQRSTSKVTHNSWRPRSTGATRLSFSCESV